MSKSKPKRVKRRSGRVEQATDIFGKQTSAEAAREAVDRFIKYRQKVELYVQREDDLQGAELKALVSQLKDIGNWTKKPFHEFEQFTRALSDVRSANQIAIHDKRCIKDVFRRGKLRVFIPLTEGAAREYGKATCWCVTSKVDSKFSEYVHEKGDTLYYAIVAGGIDERLMHDDEFVFRYRSGDTRTEEWKRFVGGDLSARDLEPKQKAFREMYSNATKAEYDRVAILVVNNTEAGGAAPEVRAFDVFDNDMTGQWLDMFNETYGIPPGTWTLRHKRVGDGYEISDGA